MFNLPFYPDHEYGCKHVKACPHLGGASLGTLVLAGRDHAETFRGLNLQLDAERKRSSKLFVENQKLEARIEQLKLELRLERQNKFATTKQKADCQECATGQSAGSKTAGKRGAPQGHVGWYRQTPAEYDVRANKRGHCTLISI